MTGAGWALARWVARSLELDEREAALGDLAESSASPGSALLDIASLAARRQAALWSDWRPWVALFGIAGPVAMLATNSLPGLDLYLWVLRNYSHFDVDLLAEHGLTAPRVIATVASHAAMAALWAWTGGFVLGALSRRAIWIPLTAFCCLAGFGLRNPFGVTLAERSHLVLGTAAATVFLPLAWGAWLGLRRKMLRTQWAILAAAAVGASMTASFAMGGWRGGGLAALILCWPPAYLVVSSTRAPKERTQ